MTSSATRARTRRPRRSTSSTTTTSTPSTKRTWRTRRSGRSSTTSRSATTTASPTTSRLPSTTASSRARVCPGVGDRGHRGLARAAGRDGLQAHPRAGGGHPARARSSPASTGSRSPARTLTRSPTRSGGRPGPRSRSQSSAGTGSSREVTLTRREVEIPQVAGHRRTSNGTKVGYVRLAGFFPGAHAELRKEVEQLYSQGAQGIVLDLRGNGGGLLTEAVLVSSIFVPDGAIVSTHGRTQSTRTFDATGRSAAAPPDGRPDQRRHRLRLGDRHGRARAGRASRPSSGPPPSARARSRR